MPQQTKGSHLSQISTAAAIAIEIIETVTDTGSTVKLVMNILKDSALENVTKDIGEISTRLLDHRPVLQGEIKYFIREFETKRNDREYKRLEGDLQKLKEVNDTVGPDCLDMMKEHIPNLLDQLEAANKICSNLQSQEEKHMEIQTLEGQRKRREENWSYFLEELSKERDKEDVQHAKEIQEIEDHFAKLEETLNTSTT